MEPYGAVQQRLPCYLKSDGDKTTHENYQAHADIKITPNFITSLDNVRSMECYVICRLQCSLIRFRGCSRSYLWRICCPFVKIVSLFPTKLIIILRKENKNYIFLHRRLFLITRLEKVKSSTLPYSRKRVVTPWPFKHLLLEIGPDLTSA